MKLAILISALLVNIKPHSQPVKFTSDSVIIDSKLCFRFQKSNDTFFIYTLENKEIVKWQVKSLGEGKFSSTYFFPTINREYFQESVYGRNALVFLMVQNKLIKNCELDERKLIKFIDKNSLMKIN